MHGQDNVVASGVRGIQVENPFAVGPNSGVVAHMNCIEGNSAAALEEDLGGYSPVAPGSLDATNNWWGSPSGPTIGSNPGGTGDRIIDTDGVVAYSPWTTTQPAAPCPLIKPTSTKVKCSPNPVAVPGPTTCTATVTDTSSTKTTPTGTVSFEHTNTGTFGPEKCVLTETSVGVARCSVEYAPTMTGTHKITANYSGDLTHKASKGSTTVNATPTGCESGDSDDHHQGDDQDQGDRSSGAQSSVALSGFSQPLFNSVKSDECDNDQNDPNGDQDNRGSDGD